MNVTWHVAEPMNSLGCPQIIRRNRDKNVDGVTNWMQKTRSFWCVLHCHHSDVSLEWVHVLCLKAHSFSLTRDQVGRIVMHLMHYNGFLRFHVKKKEEIL